MARENGTALDDESIEDRVENGEDGDEQVSMGLIEGDETVTLKNLIERGMPIETEVSLGSAAVPAKGLIDPHRAGMLEVSYIVKGYSVIPLRKAGVITGWKIRISVTPTFVASKATAEA